MATKNGKMDPTILWLDVSIETLLNLTIWRKQWTKEIMKWISQHDKMHCKEANLFLVLSMEDDFSVLCRHAQLLTLRTGLHQREVQSKIRHMFYIHINIPSIPMFKQLLYNSHQKKSVAAWMPFVTGLTSVPAVFRIPSMASAITQPAVDNANLQSALKIVASWSFSE